MKNVLLSVLMLVCSASFAETKIYQTDSVGNTQYHKGALVVKGDTIVKQDSVGNTQYHQQQYKIVGDRVYKTDSVGNVQYHKGSSKVGK